MEFINIEQAQKIMQNEDDNMPGLTSEDNENSNEMKNMMEYIDYVFNISGFMRLNEENELKNNIISRLYTSANGLCISIKCGLPYKCSFIYDEKIKYFYPNVTEVINYVSVSGNIVESYSKVQNTKITPTSFEIIIYRENLNNIGNVFTSMFQEKFEKCKNFSIMEKTIIITYAPLLHENSVLSVESLVKFFNPS
jgi:hypothetical protein